MRLVQQYGRASTPPREQSIVSAHAAREARSAVSRAASRPAATKIEIAVDGSRMPKLSPGNRAAVELQPTTVTRARRPGALRDRDRAGTGRPDPPFSPRLAVHVGRVLLTPRRRGLSRTKARAACYSTSRAAMPARSCLRRRRAPAPHAVAPPDRHRAECGRPRQRQAQPSIAIAVAMASTVARRLRGIRSHRLRELQGRRDEAPPPTAPVPSQCAGDDPNAGNSSTRSRGGTIRIGTRASGHRRQRAAQPKARSRACERVDGVRSPALTWQVASSSRTARAQPAFVLDELALSHRQHAAEALQGIRLKTGRAARRSRRALASDAGAVPARRSSRRHTLVATAATATPPTHSSAA